MKLVTLFAKYLYQNKTLNLPGIGVFSLDPSLTVPDVTDKNFSEFIQRITYTQKNIIQADDAFISFIRTETGKIRPLAESDLDSFLSDGKILLNIGKPFHIEGIGSLLKTKAGVYEFTPGEPMMQRLESLHSEKSDEMSKRRSIFHEAPSQQTNKRKLLIAGAIVVGLILIIWLGYAVYNRNVSSGSMNAMAQSDTIVIAPSDTSKANAILDSVQKIIDSSANRLAAQQKGTYRFVIEKTSSKSRAIRRYNQLKDNVTNIKMESPDSILFKLYFILPSTPADTARIRDSLKLWYGRKQVFVE